MASQYRYSECGTGATAPCDCGVLECTIAENDFSTDINNMTIVAGTPAISGGLLEMAASDDVVFDDGVPTSDDGSHITAPLQIVGTSGVFRFKLCYTNASNYLFGELSIAAGAGTIRVGERSGGVDSYLSDAVTLNDTGADLLSRHTLDLCLQPGVTQTQQSTSSSRYPGSVTGASWTDPNLAARETDGGTALWLFDPLDTTSDPLSAGDFRFRIPNGSTIDGIRVGVKAGTTALSTVTGEATVGATTRGPETMPGATPGWVIFGSNTDDWGGVTWEDVNDAAFGVSFTFTNLDGDEQLTVDAILVEVFYTTPSRTYSAKLEFTYTNTSDASVQCARARNLQTPSGLQGGFLASSGDWTLADATYSLLYRSPDRTECPDCGCVTTDGEICPDCCTAGAPPLVEYILDFGSGGWTNDECSFCPDIAGAILVEQVSGCIWVYREEISCVLEPEAGHSCTWTSVELTSWAVSLHLEYDAVEDACKFVAAVSVAGGSPTSDPTSDCPPVTTSEALYESDFLTPDDCQPTFPITLTKVFDATGRDCDGALPATISLEEP